MAQSPRIPNKDYNKLKKKNKHIDQRIIPEPSEREANNFGTSVSAKNLPGSLTKENVVFNGFNRGGRPPNKVSLSDPFRKVKKQYEKEKLKACIEKEKRHKNFLKNKKEKELYMKKRRELSKKFRQKNKKGQPIMKHRIELLLSKL